MTMLTKNDCQRIQGDSILTKLKILTTILTELTMSTLLTILTLLLMLVITFNTVKPISNSIRHYLMKSLKHHSLTDSQILWIKRMLAYLKRVYQPNPLLDPHHLMAYQEVGVFVWATLTGLCPEPWAGQGQAGCASPLAPGSGRTRHHVPWWKQFSVCISYFSSQTGGRW